MYDILYSHQDELIDSEIEFFAQQGIPGLDLKKFEADIASPSLKARIAQQVAEADLLKVNATPSFLLRATSGGTPVCYCGVGKMAGSQTISDLAAKPPWLTGH
jgi:protein-disulfide isomerase